MKKEFDDMRNSYLQKDQELEKINYKLMHAL